MAILQQSAGIGVSIFPQGWLEEARPTDHIIDYNPKILTEDHRETIAWSAELIIHGIDLLI